MANLGRPLKVGILCSGRAPGLLHVLNRDPRRGTDYEIVCAVTSEETFAEEVRVERRGIPCVPHSIGAFCHEHGASRADLDARAEYDRATLKILEPYHPDVLVLDGYGLLLTRPVQQEYDGRIIDVHPSDLLQRTSSGAVRYPGLRAVHDALMNGETETRASAHIVTDVLDDGPLLLRSWSFQAPPIAAWARTHDAWDVLRATAWAHQEWMLRDAWGPMLARSIELAGLAMVRPDAPLDPARAGRWALAFDGAFTPDGTMAETL